MKFKNRSWSPRVITLQGGKSLTVPGRGIEEVSDEDFKGAEFQRLAKSGGIVALPEKKKKPVDKGGEPGQPGKESEPSQPAARPPEGGEGDEPQ